MVERFERPRIIRPPSEAESYFLPLTSGCSNHSCTFCNYFYGSKLRLREVDDIKKEIDALALFQERGVCLQNIPDVVYYIAQQWDGRKVFLQDGDALVYPFSGLKEVLFYLNEKFPELERIGTYATPQDLLRISPEQLKTLKELKLGIIYMGVESGDDEILLKIDKGVNHEQIIEAGRKAKEAGITLSVTVILGLGGLKDSARHAKATARVLSSIDPEYAGALTITLVPGTPLYDDWKQGNFTLISPLESLKELKMIIENSEFSNCFFSSMHASNYLPIRGTLPGDKAAMIAHLQQVIEKEDPSLLRPEYLRGL
jgi:radical SAM superfamily enzyme YgiQ (UPF0313 family)